VDESRLRLIDAMRMVPCLELDGDGWSESRLSGTRTRTVDRHPRYGALRADRASPDMLQIARSYSSARPQTVQARWLQMRPLTSA
jgi:hypothetical protein